MQDKDVKKISTDVSKDCWKKLKMLSIDKEITLSEYVKDVLEKFVSKKGNILDQNI